MILMSEWEGKTIDNVDDLHRAYESIGKPTHSSALRHLQTDYRNHEVIERIGEKVVRPIVIFTGKCNSTGQIVQPTLLIECEYCNLDRSDLKKTTYLPTPKEIAEEARKLREARAEDGSLSDKKSDSFFSVGFEGPRLRMYSHSNGGRNSSTNGAWYVN